MARPNIITGLDIGSSSIKMVSVAKKSDSQDFEILGQYQENSFGVRKGVVVDAQKVAEIISSLIEKAGRDSELKINSAYVSIGGCHIFCTSSRGLVSVSRADQKISEEDVDRVIQNSHFFPLPANKEILEIFPREFVVDGEAGIKEPAGMQGARLEVDVLALCGFSPYLKNSLQSVSSAGLQSDFIAIPLASAKAVLTPREKELGVVLLDIGAGTTSLAVFEEGSLIHAAVMPVGSENITRDIAICLKTDIDVAERIKLEFGTCKSSKGRKIEKKIKIEGEEPLDFSQKMLIEIIEARVSEILDFTVKELKKISRQGMLPAGVVLTGGGAKLPGIKDLAKKELGLPSRIGIPRGFTSSLEDPCFSVVCGLILEGMDLKGSKGISFSGAGIKNKIKKVFKMFIP
jgi:cell division protein FtsA